MEIQTWVVELRVGVAGSKKIEVHARSGRQAMDIAEEQFKIASKSVSAITVAKKSNLLEYDES